MWVRMRPGPRCGGDVGCEDNGVALDRQQVRFSVPVPRAGVAVGAAITERLFQSVGRVAMVCAPAGYGKTTQLAGWTVADERAAAWADLERLDNDPIVLLAVLVQLLGAVTDFDADALPPARSAPTKFRDVVVPAFGRLVAGCRSPFVIVFDDVHTIESDQASISSTSSPATCRQDRRSRSQAAACHRHHSVACG